MCGQQISVQNLLSSRLISKTKDQNVQKSTNHPLFCYKDLPTRKCHVVTIHLVTFV
jgi:hypothetical protein